MSFPECGVRAEAGNAGRKEIEIPFYPHSSNVVISVSVWNKAILNWSGPHLLSSPLTQDPTAGDAWIKKELGETMEEPRTAMVLAPPPPPIAVPPMHPFLEHTGEPPEQWAHWIAQFDTFWTMVTIGRGSSYTEQDKSRYLELMLGTEGRRLVRHTPGVLALETSSHDAYRTAVRDILVPKTSPFRAIATFLTRKQRLGESILWCSGGSRKCRKEGNRNSFLSPFQ